MSVQSILTRGQAAAKARMTETVAVGPFTEHVDRDSLATTRTFDGTVYADIGQIKYPSLTVSEGVAVSQQVTSADVVLKVPAGAAPLVREGHLVRVTASSIDGTLVGREYRVKAFPQSGQVTAHRFPIEELS